MSLRRTKLIQGPPGPPGVVTVVQAWTPGTILSGAFAVITVAVTGAALGLPVLPPGWSAALPDGMFLTAQVVATGSVKVYMFNLSGSSQTPAAGSLHLEVLTQ